MKNNVISMSDWKSDQRPELADVIDNVRTCSCGCGSFNIVGDEVLCEMCDDRKAVAIMIEDEDK